MLSFCWFVGLIYNVNILSQGAAANPDSEEQQQKLREAAEGLRMATNAAAQNAIKKRLVNKLEVTPPTGLEDSCLSLNLVALEFSSC